MDTPTLGGGLDCRHRALCARYALVVLATTGCSERRSVRVAVGFLGHGQWEALGAWSTGCDADLDSRIARDLWARGLERAGLVAVDLDQTGINESLPPRQRHMLSAAKRLIRHVLCRVERELRSQHLDDSRLALCDRVASVLLKTERTSPTTDDRRPRRGRVAKRAVRGGAGAMSAH